MTISENIDERITLKWNTASNRNTNFKAGLRIGGTSKSKIIRGRKVEVKQLIAKVNLTFYNHNNV